MNIAWTTLLKYLSQAAIEELAERYSAEGWRVQRNAPIAKTHADLVARRGDEVLVFEVKAPSGGATKSRDIRALRRYVRDHPNASLKLVFVRPPRPVDIEVTGLSETLQSLCADRVGQLALGDIASNVLVEGVTDVEISQVRIEPGAIQIEGSAAVDVTLEYGKGGDYTALGDSYPFDFDLVFDSDLDVTEVKQLDVDVSSFYGQDD